MAPRPESKPGPKRGKKKAPRNDMDDTPRQFKRMMEMREQMNRPKQQNTRPAPKKTKSQQNENTAEQKEALKIKRGESMSEFSRRVDAAIPLPTKARGGDSRKELRNAKKHKAKAENLRSEYHQKWDAKRRREEEAEAEAENIDVSDDGEDVWASVNAKAKKPKFGEVADRPPQLPKLKQFSSVPKSAGSLARREILEAERQRVIDQYRKLRGHEEPDLREEEEEEE